MDKKWNKKKMASIVLAATIVLSALVIVMPSMAQNNKAKDFGGTWTNVDSETRGMVKFIITQIDSEYNFHGYGACHPTPCDWGTTRLTLYSRSISDTENIAGTAEYDVGFVENRIFLEMLNPNLIKVHSFEEFKDASGRPNYVSIEYFTRVAVPEFTTPTQLSPADGSVFEHYPRTTTLEWTAVPGATSYTVEIDCYRCCQSGKWCTDIGKTGQLVPDIKATSYTFDFVGAQPGRWRVWAVYATGQESPKTNWWEFRYTT